MSTSFSDYGVRGRRELDRASEVQGRRVRAVASLGPEFRLELFLGYPYYRQVQIRRHREEKKSSGTLESQLLYFAISQCLPVNWVRLVTKA